MNNNRKRIFLACSIASLLVACGGEDPGQGASPVLLSPNALNTNSLDFTALGLQSLTPNGLSARNRGALVDPGLTGILTRELVRYSVTCAFDPSQSFAFAWTDVLGIVHNENYAGLLGLATSWQTQALSTTGQQWVTACLAARVNWYGVPVTISSRGNHPALRNISAREIAAYNKEEGAFWGNLFSGSAAYLYACHYDPNVAYARSVWRDCAAGHLTAWGTTVDCGLIHVVGSCDTYCDPLDRTGYYHPQCTGPNGKTTDSVVTTFLP